MQNNTFRKAGQKIVSCMIIGVFLLVPIVGFGKTYTPREVPNPKTIGQGEYVSNPDNIIGSEDVAYLNKCAAMIESNTLAELAVVAIESIGEQDMFEFTRQLFQLWGIGKEGKNTGVLICFVLDSHDIRIMTGQGIEGVLPDAVCKRIISEDMIPSFREEKYGEGLCLGALRIYETCSEGDAPEELLNMKSVTRRQTQSGEDDDSFFWWFLLAAVVGIFGVASVRAYRATKCPKCGKHTLSTRKQTLVAASYAATGVGLATKRCKHCGYKSEKKFTIPRLTHSTGSVSGGGFSGGSSGGSWGGGSTMGGGAGGKW